MDGVILYLPCRPVWRLQLPKRQRLSILAILFAGLIPPPPPNRTTDLRAYDPTSVTIASLVRMAYFVVRFYRGGRLDNSLTEFRVNVITTIELDLAQVCCCLPILKPFIRQYAPSLLRLHTHTARSKERSSAHPAASSQHPIKAGRKWPGAGSRDEELIGANYLELGEDGKSDQSYVMSTTTFKPGN
ncbi:hypothetical protein MMC29_000795 [Sticta canariensis]|nr:hypothetical protein [Sticta canariensis]